METTTTHHANHKNGQVRHAKRGAKKAMQRGVSLATRAGDTFKRIEHQVERGLSRVAGDRSRGFSGMTRWIATNPKTAVGIALGTGLLIGAIGNGKLGRTALLTLGGLIAKRFA